MSIRKAQNQVRKKYGVGKTALHKRMSATRHELEVLAYRAQWSGSWAGTFDENTKREMHRLVEVLAADSIIATAYRKAEDAARGELESCVKTTQATIDEINKRSEALHAARKADRGET